MEAAGSKLDQVYVLRQTFRPNEPFQEELSKIIIARTSDARPFLISGSDERIIDINEVGRSELNVQHRQADKFMATKYDTHLEVAGGITARLLRAPGRTAVLQLIMEPQDIRKYLQVREGLDIVRLGRRTQAVGFKAAQLYMNIPIYELRSLLEVKEGMAEINASFEDESARHLYQVTPLPYLLGRPATRITPMPKSES